MGYGKNGDTSASSDLPGKKTTSGFLPAVDLASAVNVQTRQISAEPYKTTFGTRDRNPDSRDSKIPGALVDDQAEPVRQPG